MGRRAKGWEIRPRGKKKVLYIRFRRAGVRYEISTGTSDVREADARAAEIYAEHLTKRPEPKLDRPAKLHLGVIAAKWIPAIRGSTHASNTATLYELHLRAHLIPFFERLDNVSTGTIGEYQRARLKEVTRATVIKERSTLASFLSWCKEQGLLQSVPEFPPIPKGALGHRAGARKQKAADVSPEQVARFLAALPEMSIGKIHQSHRFPVRARYIVAWETGLRPSTLDKLSVPEHYKKGQRELVITDSIDKARFGRSLPLTEAARAALDSVVTKNGLVFGRRCYRMYVAAARLAAEMPAGFSPYDLRHGRALALTEASGNLPGVAFLLGHRKLTTTDRYLRATRRAADAVLASGDRGAAEGAGGAGVEGGGVSALSVTDATEGLIGEVFRVVLSDDGRDAVIRVSAIKDWIERAASRRADDESLSNIARANFRKVRGPFLSAMVVEHAMGLRHTGRLCIADDCSLGISVGARK